MAQIINLALLLLFIPRTTREFLLSAYWWQVKEYRPDRFWVFLKMSEGRANFTPLVFWVKLFILFSFPLILFTKGFLLFFVFLIGLVFLVEDFFLLKELVTRKMRRPVFTLRAKRILATGAVLILLAFWGAYWLGFYSKTLEWAIFLLVVDKFTLVIVPLGIAWTAVSVARRKKFEVREARFKLENIPKLVSVGITGSYGKTSTKEFLAQILSAKFRVAKTTGGENTEFGIARKVQANVKKNTQVFVAEMGAYKKGEVKRLTDIVRPKIGIITGITPQHLELFGSLKNIMETKYELIEALPKDGTAIFNGSNPYCRRLAQRTKKVKTLIYQMGKPKKKITDKLWAEDIKVDRDKLTFWVRWRREKLQFKVPLLGRQSVENLLAASACALALGMTLSEISKAIQKISPLERTMEPHYLTNGTFVIDDTYNSNPTGFAAALNFIETINFEKRLVITPGIIELGQESKKIHKKLGARLAKIADKIYLTSSDFQEFIKLGMGKNSHKLVLEKNIDLIIDALKGEVGKKDVVLLEGRIPEALRQKLLEL